MVVVATADASARERFLALPGVDSVDADGPSMTIRGRNPSLVTDVIQCVSRHGITVTDFHTTVPSLEDVFLRLTGHSIRD